MAAPSTPARPMVRRLPPAKLLIMLGGPNPAEVRAGLDAMMAHIEGGAAFRWANDAQDTAFLAHVVSRTGSYLSSAAGIAFGRSDRLSGGAAAGATFGIDAAMKSADVQLVTYVPPPSETNYSAAFLTGSQAACRSRLQCLYRCRSSILPRHPVQRA